MGVQTPLAWFELDDLPSYVAGRWKCTTAMDLARGPASAARRGTVPDIVPNTDGALVNPQWLDGTEREMTWTVWPTLDADGDPHPNTAVGLELNLEALDAALGIPDNDDSTRTCVLHLPSGRTRTGPVQVLDWDPVIQLDHTAIARMLLYIPAGYLPLDPEGP